MLRRFLAWSVFVCSVTLAAGAPVAFPQADSDLKADPQALFGTLPNGLRYVVRPNHEPKGQVSLRLLVLAGSFQEKPEQRGLAHFLEHMAFNGSTHFAPGTLVERLQRLGMGFGADTNASTSFDHTLYQLELPNTEPATVTEGLQILADYGGGLLLEQAMVDKERGIILSEKRSRDSVGYRTFVASAEFMQAGTRVPERLPIGLTDVIEKSNRERFVDFYDTWYRPELLTVLVVGDIDPAAVQKQITGMFSGLKARSPEPAPVDLGKVESFQGLRTRFHSEPEAPNTEVTIASLAPYTREPDTSKRRIELLPRMLAVEMLNRRLDVLAKKENAPFIRASTDIEESFGLTRQAEISVICKAEQWTSAVAVAEQELRRALVFGFRPDELKEAVADFRNDLIQAAKAAPTRHSDEIANELAETLVDREVFTSAQQDLELYGHMLDSVSVVDCAQALISAWRVPGRYVYVAGNAKIEGDADKAILEAYRASARVLVKPTESHVAAAWGYTDFGPKGKVESRQHLDDLDATLAVLSNGVRLNLKKTNFEANQIHVLARLGDGQLTQPTPGLAAFTTLIMRQGGLGKHSVDDLNRILSGHTAGVTFGTVIDSFSLQGDTSREDLALEFQWLAAQISDPGFRPESMRVTRKRIESSYLSFAHTLGGPLALDLNRYIVGGDSRFGLPEQSVMMGYTIADVKAWLSPVLAAGPLEVTIVGDIDVDATLDLAAQTLGTLPARSPRGDLGALTQVHFPQPFTKEYAVDTEIAKSLVQVYWPTGDGLDVHRKRRLGLLAEVLTDRLRVKVREQLGSTYSPDAESAASEVFPGYGYLVATVEVAPEKAKMVQDVVIAIAQDLHDKGVTPDEFDRARNPLLKNVKQTERENGYWMTVLNQAQQHPEHLEWARNRESDFQSITKEDLDALAKNYLGSEHASRALVHPREQAKPAAPGVTPPPDST